MLVGKGVGVAVGVEVGVRVGQGVDVEVGVAEGMGVSVGMGVHIPRLSSQKGVGRGMNRTAKASEKKMPKLASAYIVPCFLQRRAASGKDSRAIV